MGKQTYTARHVSRAYSGFLKIDLYDATVSDGTRTVEITREVHDHGHGATVLPYDEARRTCLLVRQVRLPVHATGEDGLFLETAAGLTDPEDEGPAQTAAREAEEELGYKVHELQAVGTVYTIPGLVTERMTFFLARYTPADRLEDRALDDDEVIDVEEWALAEAWRAVRDGRLSDVKAVLCLQALRIERPELFEDGTEGTNAAAR